MNLRRGSRGAWRSLSLSACLLLALPAHSADPQAPSAGVAVDEDQDGFIDILVTDDGDDSYRAETATSSTRTPTPLQETPQSVSVVTRRLIEDQQVDTVADALANVAGVVPTNPLLTPAFDTTLIRGFAAEQMIDGFTQLYAPGDRQSLANVERIEVLKGPNGLLYGGGAGSPAGGAVNLISKPPRAAAFRTLGVRVGSWQLVQPYFDLNQPIGERVRMRVTGEWTHESSEIDVVEGQRFNVNPALALGIGPDTTLTVRGTVSRWRQPDYQGLPATGTVARSDAAIDPALADLVDLPDGPIDATIDRDLFIGDPDVRDSRSSFDSVALHLDHRFGETWSASVQGRWAQSSFEENAQLVVGAGLDFGADRPIVEPPELATALGLGALPFALMNARLSQEQDELSFVANAVAERAWGPTRNTLLLGADHSRYDDSGFLRALAVTDNFVVDLADPTFDQPFEKPGPDDDDNFVVNTISGAYVQLQTTAWERLHLLAGVRLGRVHIDFEGPGAEAVTSEIRWIPRAGAVLDLGAGVSAFVGYGRGLRGQPFAIFTDTPLPEESMQLEAGFKASRGDWLQGQVAWFSIERDHVTVPDPDGGVGSIAAGQQASRGVDAELVLQPIESLSLIAAYAWTRASFEDDLFASFGSDLDDIPGVPEHAGRLWADYRFGSWLRGVRIGAGVYAESDVQVSRRNDFRTDAFFTIDASVAYETSRFLVGLRVANLTDEDYFVRLGYLGGRVAPGASRSWQLSASVRF
jgi:iron complex outermembrane receptor protein